MKKCLLIFLLISVSALAYTPDASIDSSAQNLSGQLGRVISRMTPEVKNRFIATSTAKLIELQNALIGSNLWDRMYIFEYLRRHMPGVTSFSEPDTIYDELTSTIWNHAPDGFSVLYRPFDTMTVENNDPEQDFSVLVNGGYFNRVDGSLYHAGILALGGQRQTPFAPSDPQLTHSLCVDGTGRISFILNVNFSESLIDSCTVLFQAGPLVYDFHDGKTQQNFMFGQYLGRAHKRTAIVVFEKNTKQDVWFLTINEPITLQEMTNSVLRETRFLGKYDALSLFNLDGGSSVAHMNYAHPELNIGHTKVLPIVLGIK